MSDRDDLLALINELAVVRGRVVLSSGREAAYYIDLRRITLHHRAAPLVGRVMAELTADWDYSAVGGLTLGADPVATAIMHQSTRDIDAFVVRKPARLTAYNAASKDPTSPASACWPSRTPPRREVVC